jgi:formylglycine-generating enzyme required for sulfatase activity
MLLVPAGPFVLGSTQSEGEPDERPQRTLRLSAFFLDRTEVTVAQYRACLGAGACSPPATQRFCNLQHPGKDDHPVNCVRWQQAADYCEWAGARLPTEAEWEKAARGTEGDPYPWGPTPDTCVVAVRFDEKLGHACGEFGTWPVGSKPFGKSPFGALDMAGNVWEWVADWYASDAYASAPEQDPKGPGAGKYRILRGGGWGKDGPGALRSARRFKFTAEHATPGIGFRCASSAP